jgi:TatA/E family protein of Tat protein translocase
MEIILVLVVAVLLFGPAKIPEMARSLGRATREFKDSVSGTGITEALGDMNDVRTAVKPSNLAKAAMPAPVKEMAAGVTEMKETFTDPLGTKKAEAEADENGAASDQDAPSAPMPASREMPVAAAPVVTPAPAPETPAAPSA